MTNRGRPKESNSFGIFVGGKLKKSELRAKHPRRLARAKFTEATENGRNGAVRAVGRLSRWAIRRRNKGIITSPIESVEMPQYVPRDVRITADEWTKLLKAFPAGDEFVDFLKCLRATGMRPFELRTVEARHLQDGALIFDIVESTGKKVRRSVPLNDTALAILKPLAEKRPTGQLLRNRRGNAWTKFAAVDRFRKYRELAGLGEHITIYAIRHEFISAAIETGEVDPLSLSKIVGHRDLTMISWIYSHLGAKSDRLQKMVRKAIGEMAD